MSGISYFVGKSLGTSLICNNGMPALPGCPDLQRRCSAPNVLSSEATCYHEGPNESNSHACRQKNQHRPEGRPHWESGLLSQMCPGLSSGITVFFFPSSHYGGWNTGSFCTPRALYSPSLLRRLASIKPPLTYALVIQLFQTDIIFGIWCWKRSALPE